MPLPAPRCKRSPTMVIIRSACRPCSTSRTASSRASACNTTATSRDPTTRPTTRSSSNTSSRWVHTRRISSEGPLMKPYLIATVLGLGAVFSQTASAAALKVFACESEWGALLQELGGDHLDVYVATSALQDVHKIQPRPSLIAKYRQADLVVCTGSELEIGWLPPLAQKGNNPKVIPGAHGYFEASHYLQMLEVPAKDLKSLEVGKNVTERLDPGSR